MPSVDVLIVGQGLAGSTLAWRLAEVGLTFAVVDRGGRDDHGNPSASRVAAGLMTPVTGKRLTLDPEWDTLRDAAAAFYRRVERVAGAAFFHERPSLRLLRSDEERQRFEERAKEPLYATHMQPAAADGRYNADATRHGGFVMPSAARLEAAAFLDATSDWLRSSGRLYECSLDGPNDLETTPSQVLIPELDLAARVVVDCRGFTTADPLLADSPVLTPLKGEVLVVEGPGLPDDRVVHCGVWLVPVERGRGDEGQTRCLLGATYAPDDATSH
ncbi:MAG: FAD-binding oxidoreductase, partial [Planctomycetota bacterium]